MNLPFTVPRPNMASLRNARANFLRRGPAAGNDSDAHHDLERQSSREPLSPRQEPEMQERAAATAARSLLGAHLGGGRSSSNRPSFFSRFTNSTDPVQAARDYEDQRQRRRQQQDHPGPDSRPSSSVYDDEVAESPKTPQFALGMPPLPSTRLHLPNLARTWTQGSNGPPTAASQRGAPPVAAAAGVAEPVPALPADMFRTQAPSVSRRSSRRFQGADPAELHLASLVEDSRRRRRRQRRRGEGSGEEDEDRENREGGDDDEARARRRRRRAHRRAERERRSPPKHFLFCFPWIKSKRIRTNILRCFVSGIFLALLLTVYLALSITKNINSSEFTVMLILIILCVTIFFCHGLIRLCMLIVRGPRNAEEEERRRLPQMYGPGGYAIPRQPIRVVLARDEEAAGLDSETTKMRPPAYGLWRESVRVDPDRIYWQRNENAAPAEHETQTGLRGGGGSDDGQDEQQQRRPPSYASDDGVSYVVEAQPRSIAPTTEVPLPLPQHPAEAGRAARPAAW
ncbi:uncharacterized protein E0L32_010282 [Thyridium curvatum]|uniref:Uncharacterized protein n=1 Tax=Thyridium curvatum TaxID=1093900 RepID=A0A507AGS6_9PEZI|nr:uncharacterized protein E0L32_010282 [Thyridium curvatum]TPX08082.1 hypothetical protein E0L32_010282 [Thyridium curvatum]